MDKYQATDERATLQSSEDHWNIYVIGVKCLNVVYDLIGACAVG
jgi:hypothetical protein